jgi:hypothetical protein
MLIVAERINASRKAIIGPRLRARCLAGQRTEAAIGVAVLNRMPAPPQLARAAGASRSRTFSAPA